MKKILGILFSILIISSCDGQNEKTENGIIGGPCEDCEAALDYSILNIKPRSSLTIEAQYEDEMRLRITGTVLKPDGITPAENIILYVYHTNREGVYEPSKKAIGWEKRHGQYRGWIKTGANGRYELNTFRPAAYPNGIEPEHIHIYVKEPNIPPYYIDNYVFADDPLLTSEERKSLDNRGGSGILKLKTNKGIFTAKRNIILGLNIPGYN